MEKPKFQISNYKQILITQISNLKQIPQKGVFGETITEIQNPKRDFSSISLFGSLEIEYWVLFGIWLLVLGISPKEALWQQTF